MPAADTVFNPLLWLVAWVGAYAVVTNVLWSIDHRPATAIEAAIVGVADDPGRALVARALLLSAPLILAAALRLAEPAELGLVRPVSALSVGAAVIIAAVTAGTLVVAHDRFVHAARLPPRAPAGLEKALAGRLLLIALALELWWAFARGAVLVVGLANTVLAVFLALGLLGLQAWSNPARRAALLDPEACPAVSRGAALAVASAMVFLATGSLAACVAAHVAVRLTLAHAGLDRPTASRDASPVVDASQVEPTIV